MTLNGSLLERTQQAIVDTFSREELRQFVRFELEETFEAILRDDNLGVQAYELLLWAGRHGREQELLDKLRAERRTEVNFAAVAEALHTGEPLIPPGSLYTSLPTYGRVPLQKPLRVRHFIGRNLELARLLAYLEPGKIMTLSGPGGIGKTAIAAEAIWRLAPGDAPPDRFPDGVIFHSFYHQPQTDLALEAIASAYHVNPQPSPRNAALQALAGRQALLVLDGAEAATDLDSVLTVAGSCGVLITSRRNSDAPDDFQDIGPLVQQESLDLLRAWAGTYAEDDTASNEIVHLLGGLPLALFLVGRYLAQRRQKAPDYGAWLKEQGLEALHFGDRPSKSVPLLLSRSLEQVSATAQAAFGVAGILALAPFEADIIAGALDIMSGAANYALGELVDYGLLLRPNSSYEVTHALAHSYARTQATPAAEIINRLAMYFAAIANNESKKGLPGYAALDRQHFHIVAVQTEALKAEQWDAVRQITWAMRDYSILRGYWTNHLIITQAGLDAARAAGHRNDEGAFLNILGLAFAAQDEPHRAIELYEQILVITREIGDRRGEGSALGNLGLAYADLGEPRRAIELYEQVKSIMCEIGDRRGEGIALNNLGLAYADLDEPRRAIEYHEQALVISHETNDRRGESIGLSNIGLAYADLGEPHRSIEYHEQALTILREVGDRRGERTTLSNLGFAYADLGEPYRAIEYHEQALVITREIGDRHRECIALRNIGLAYADVGELYRAIEYHEQALVAAREVGDRQGECLALGNLGTAYESLGEPYRAIEYHEQALVVIRAMGDRHWEGVTLVKLGLAYGDSNRVRRAIEYHEQALVVLHEVGDRQGEGTALGNLGAAYAALGESHRAIEFFEQQLVIVREIDDRHAEAIASWNLGLIYEETGELARALTNMRVRAAYEQEIGHPDAASYAQRVADIRARAGK